MKTTSIVAALIALLGLTGCSVVIDNEGKECQTDADCDPGQTCDTTGEKAKCIDYCIDRCTGEGDTRCDGDVIQTCTRGAGGCLDWTDGIDCTKSNETCDDAGGTAQCIDTCTNECTTLGETRCSGTIIQTCTEGTDGCLDWVGGTDCDDSGQFCDDTGGAAQCVDTCTSNCDTLNDTRCTGTVLQTCTQVSNCLNWVDTANCATNGQICDDSGDTAQCITPCTNECNNKGDTRCNGTVIQNCVEGADGCLDWTDGDNCADTSQYCDDGSGTAQCVDTCTDECTTVGATQCDGSVIQTCTQISECKYWVDGINCASNTQLCDDSGGSAQCVDCFVDTDCGICQWCDNKVCQNQSTGSDVKSDCLEDGAFCNGVETCNGSGACYSPGDPCSGQMCDEANDQCVDCMTDADCGTCEQCVIGSCQNQSAGSDLKSDCTEDGTFCNGVETCNGSGACYSPGDPCSGQVCDESNDQCVDCLADADCGTCEGCVTGSCQNQSAGSDLKSDCTEDGTFCNGIETCNGSGACYSPGDPCTGQMCDETNDQCVDCLADADCGTCEQCVGGACQNQSAGSDLKSDCTEDGTFCNGIETCNGSGACYSPGDPCSGQTCDEGNDQCISDNSCTLVFSEDFNDNDISDWVAESLYTHVDGSSPLPEAVGGIYYHPTTSSSAGGGHHHILSQTIQGISFEIRFRARGAISANQTTVGLFVDGTQIFDDPYLVGYGYACQWYPAGNRITICAKNGSKATCEKLAEATVTGDENWHEISCIHKMDGTWEIVFDGQSQNMDQNTADQRYTSFEQVTTFVDSDSSLRALDDIKIFDCSRCPRVFFDDFNDNDITDWEEESLYFLSDNAAGRWTPGVADGVYKHLISGLGGGGHHRALDTPIDGPAFEMRARVRGAMVLGQTTFGVFADDLRETCPGGVCGHGYLCMWYPVNNFADVWYTDGNPGIQLLARATVVGDDAWHDLACIHLADGTWQIKLDGVLQTLTVNDADTRFNRFEFVSTWVDIDQTADLDLRALDDIQIFDCNLVLDWVEIPGGTFMMGSDTGEADELPVHQVTVPTFEMTRTEVTIAQYQACVDAAVCTDPDDFTVNAYCNWGQSDRDYHPVNCVDWNQALAFCQWAGGRLSTEAEWEYAGRSGGQDIEYPWGNDTVTCQYAVMDEGGYGCGMDRTWPVGSKMAGNTAQGLFDMTGSVWEWTQDWHHNSYTGAPVDGSAWEDPVGTMREIRGGSWGNGAVNYLRSSNRERDPPTARLYTIGFRCARDSVDWVQIPGGTFMMGSPGTELGRETDETQHEVTLTRDFEIMKYDLTQGEFESLMGWNPSGFTVCGLNCPVETVSWYDAVACSNQLSTQAGYTPCYQLSNVVCVDSSAVGSNYMDCFNDVKGGINAATVELNSVISVFDCEGYRLPTEAEWEYAARAGTTTALYRACPVIG